MREYTPTLIGNAALRVVPGDPRVMVGNRRAILPPQELALLELFIRDPSRILNTATLAKLLRHDAKPLSAITVAVHVHRLRKRLRPIGLTIRTFRGIGYALDCAAGDAPR